MEEKVKFDGTWIQVCDFLCNKKRIGLKYYVKYDENKCIHDTILFQLRNHYDSIVRISSDIWPPSQTVVENDCTSSKCFKGQYPDVFYAIQSIMNFTFKVLRNPVAGAKLANGSWNGQIG